MNVRKRTATLASAGVLATGGLVLGMESPAAAEGCTNNGARCGTVENHTSRAIWVCTKWKGDNLDFFNYSGWKRHCPDHHAKINPGKTLGKPQRVDVDAIWVPARTRFDGDQICAGVWLGFARDNSHGYGLWYKFPTWCKIIVRSRRSA